MEGASAQLALLTWPTLMSWQSRPGQMTCLASRQCTREPSQRVGHPPSQRLQVAGNPLSHPLNLGAANAGIGEGAGRRGRRDVQPSPGPCDAQVTFP
jgi:hypothetical protein